MMTAVPTLKTQRLVLRPFCEQDALALFNLYQQDGVLQYFPNPVPPPLDKVERFISRQQAHWDQFDYGNWAVSLPGDGALLGWAGLQYIEETAETEVGYLLGRPFWGKGYATEAAGASLRFGFDHIVLTEIIALVHPENNASLRVAAKCGMIITDRKVYWGLELVRHSLKREGV